MNTNTYTISQPTDLVVNIFDGIITVWEENPNMLSILTCHEILSKYLRINSQTKRKKIWSYYTTCNNTWRHKIFFFLIYFLAQNTIVYGRSTHLQNKRFALKFKFWRNTYFKISYIYIKKTHIIFPGLCRHR